MRRLATPLLVLVLGVACSASSKDKATNTTIPGETTTVAGSSGSSNTSASIEPGATVTTAKPGTQKLTTPDAAAAHLFLAWKANNRAEAAQYASDAAVTSLFAHPYTGPEPTFQGCEKQVDQYNCGYMAAGSSIIFRVDGSASAGYRVASVDFIAD